MFVTIINDCRDANAFGRQATRTAALFDRPIQTVAVSSDIEAAGNLIDVLDASEGRPGAVLVNVAPRNGDAKRWPNGTPFCWFRYGETLVVASIDGLTLSLVKKLGLAEEVNLLDLPQVMGVAADRRLVSAQVAEYVVGTQFRSFEFVPRVARWLTQGYELPSTPLPVAEVADAPSAVWWTDNFGNCKTTLLPHEVSANLDGAALSGIAALPYYERLKDVPDGEAAFVTGSSGIGGRRFAEIVIQGGNASERFGLRRGSLLFCPADGAPIDLLPLAEALRA